MHMTASPPPEVQVLHKLIFSAHSHSACPFLSISAAQMEKNTGDGVLLTDGSSDSS